MKPLVFRALILCASFLFTFSLSAQKNNDYTEEDFKRDKELFKELDGQYMYYYSQRKDDSLYFLLSDNLPKLKRAHQFHPNDTLIAVLYKYIKINYGVSIAYYSRNMEEAIQIATPAYEDAWNDPMVNGHYYLATTAVNMADLYRLVGDKEKGLWYLQRSLEVKKRIYGENHPLVANQYKYVGIVYDEFGEYKRAEYYFNKALDIYKTNFGEYTNSCTWNLVWCYYKQNRKKEAFELLNQRIQRFESGIANNVRTHCTLLLLRGDLYFEEGQILKAKSSYIEVLNNISDVQK